MKPGKDKGETSSTNVRGKISTGILGLNKLLEGGIPEKSVVMLAGSAGTGKTIFSLQFLTEGAKKNERGLYLTFEENEDKIHDQAAQFGWDLKDLEKRNLIRVQSIFDVGIVEILQQIKQQMDDFKPKRMVIDSITFVSLAALTAKKLIDLEKTSIAEIYETMDEVHRAVNVEGLVLRKLIVDFVRIMQSKGITTLLTSEVPRESVWYSRDTFTEFACDGIIMLKSTSIGADMHRTIEIVKMRNTKIKGGIYSFNFEESGIKVNV